MINPNTLNGVALAFIGDGFYELKIREFLINQGLTKVNELHNKGVNFTSGKAQAEIMNYLLDTDYLSDDEITYFKRGRNASNNQSRKSITLSEYKKATGFESLIGYLYLTNKQRAIEVIDYSINYVIKKEI